MLKLKQPVVLYVSSFPPRECGIATFTKDLTDAMDKEFNPGLKSRILAVNDNGTSIYNYSGKVGLQLNESDMESYLNRANEINRSPQIKLINIQHEYGLFGGEWGNYLLPFMEIIKKPIVTTLHTVLPKPEEKLKKITRTIADKSEGIVVMTNHSARLLQEVYGIKKSKIKVIPHGVHHVPFPSKSKAKKKLNLSGRTIIATFGHINRDKGIEYAIRALPTVVKKYPEALYLVIGATHPIVRKYEGEIYRNMLKKEVARLKLENYVKFYDKYLELSELIDYLRATDLYLSPTLNPKQAVSGTVSYALSCACPVVSTATQYCLDVINQERGILVRFRNHKDIEKALLEILGDHKRQKEMKKNAYFFSRHMTWQNVALSYFKVFNGYAKITLREKGKLPAINLGHLKTLTDDFGIIQFANHTKPDLGSGYCLDDNTRALIASTVLYHDKPQGQLLDLITKYFKFIKFSQKANGKFHNFISQNKSMNDKSDSEDSLGRAIWALSYVISSDDLPEYLTKQAKTIYQRCQKWISQIGSPRAVAFTLLGLCRLAKAPKIMIKDNHQPAEINQIKKLANKLLKGYYRQVSRAGFKKKKWSWFEDSLTYSNYKLPEALIRTFEVSGKKEYLKVAEETLKFLTAVSFEKEYFSPIGQDGWYYRDGKRAYFDQQPEDTASAVEALTTAYEVTGKKLYGRQAKTSFDWFLGKNYLNQMIYDEATGGCYDGLGRYSINFNQGAESTISYLLARLAIERIK